MITAVMIDSREPEWAQNLKFEDAPVMTTMLEYGDYHVACDDGCILFIERKTPDDFLNTLRDDRLFPQCAQLAAQRIDGQMNNNMNIWPYLMITGEFTRGPAGKVITPERSTQWDWNAVQGALLSVQEMGVFVVFAAGDYDLVPAITRLSERTRDQNLRVLPPRPPLILGPGAALLASLPGIGVERTMDLINWGGGNIAHILSAITQLEVKTPLGMATRKKIRAMLGLAENQTLESPYFDNQQREVLALVEK